MLPAADAIGLLRTLIGDRVDAEPDAAAELAAQCARLPLALRVAAELAAASPDSRLAELAGELAGEQRRLDLLDAGGDERTAVRGVFSWSYRHLPAAAARAFRLIGLHPGPDLDAYAVAALTSAAADGEPAPVTATQAKDALALLARAHLVHPSGAGRYGMHDLLRAYARELAAAEDGAGRSAGRDDQPVRLLPGRRRQRHGRPRARPNGSTGRASSRSARLPRSWRPRPGRATGSTPNAPSWSRSRCTPPPTAGRRTPPGWRPSCTATWRPAATTPTR